MFKLKQKEALNSILVMKNKFSYVHILDWFLYEILSELMMPSRKFENILSQSIDLFNGNIVYYVKIYTHFHITTIFHLLTIIILQRDKTFFSDVR